MRIEWGLYSVGFSKGAERIVKLFQRSLRAHVSRRTPLPFSASPRLRVCVATEVCQTLSRRPPGKSRRVCRDSKTEAGIILSCRKFARAEIGESSLKSAQRLVLKLLGRDSTLGQCRGTSVPFAKSGLASIFASEQFWGRAARAPRSRKRSRRSLFGASF